MPPGPSTSSQERLLLRIAIFGALAALLHTITYGFIYDDFALITLNPWMDSWHGLRDIFTHHSTAFLAGDTVVPARHYRPLFLSWLWLVRHVAGPAPGWFHLAGLLLHVAVVCLAYLLAKEWLDQKSAAVTAIVFALHPSRAEAVSWIAAHTELLLAAFVLGAMLCYVRALSSGKWWWIAGAGVCTFAGLMTKETAVTIPALIVAHYVSQRERARGRLIAALSATLLGIAAFALLRAHVLGGGGSEDVPRSLTQTLLTTPMAICLFLRQALWPVRLSEFYNPLNIQHATWKYFGVPLLIVLVVVVLFTAAAKRDRRLWFAAAWFAVTLAPIVVGFSWIQLHDRHLYLPLFGVAMIAAIAIERIPSAVQLRVTVALAALLAVGIVVETLPWRSELDLYTRAVAVAPYNSEAIELLASAQEDDDAPAAAMRTRLDGLQRLPSSCRLMFDTGYAYYRQRDYDSAKPLLVRMAASGCVADYRSAALGALGGIALAEKDLESAERNYAAAAELAPNIPGFRNDLERVRKLRSKQ